MYQCQENDIETLSEWLESLRITEEEKATEYTDKILVALVLVTA